MLTFLNGGSNR
uniref:Uncharacterized protein n=1 Tax=Arundo donax TaxID=35708 RepID=A0A0A9EUE7_ARUDO